MGMILGALWLLWTVTAVTAACQVVNEACPYFSGMEIALLALAVVGATLVQLAWVLWPLRLKRSLASFEISLGILLSRRRMLCLALCVLSYAVGILSSALSFAILIGAVLGLMVSMPAVLVIFIEQPFRQRYHIRTDH